MHRLSVLVLVAALLGVVAIGYTFASGARQDTPATPVGVATASDDQGTPVAAGSPVQGTPVARDDAEIIVLRLGRTASELAPGKDLVLHTITFPPGSSLNPHTHPGETIFHLSSGTLHFTLREGEARLIRGVAGTPSPATPAATDLVPVGEEIIVNAGDTIFYEASALQTERNDGEDAAVAIVFNIRGAEEPRIVRGEAGTPVAATPMP